VPLRPDLDGAGTTDGKRLAMRDDRSAAELRRLARREPDRAAARRMRAIAGALEGLTRAEAARLAGMERQALRDAVVRCNAEGLAGLHDRPRPGPKPRPDEARRAAPRQLVLDGPEVETTGVSAWTPAGLCREVEARRGVRHHEGHMSKLVRAPGLSRQKARPWHPEADPAAREAFAQGGFEANWTASRPSTPAGA
jgi:putative transposase